MQFIDSGQTRRDRALSHRDYLESLHAPDEAERRRLTTIQIRKEAEIDQKYHTHEEHEAATTIQRAFRGYRDRRELEGLTLDPSARWTELIREIRFRSATLPHHKPITPMALNEPARARAASDAAKQNWQRVGHIAEHATEGGRRPSNLPPDDYLSAKNDPHLREEDKESMLMDMRYFLEMVDEKHRYGTNLQVYHEEWLRSKANQNFFYWLDRGEGMQFDLPGCTRAKLDKERIRYLSRDERLNYLVVVDDEGWLRWHKNGELITTSTETFKDSLGGIVPKSSVNAPAFTDAEVIQQRDQDLRTAHDLVRVMSPDWTSISETSSGSESAENLVQTHDDDKNFVTPGHPTRKEKHQKHFHVSPATVLNHLLRASIKPGTWIYVSDLSGRLYVGIKSSGAFQHASFLSGARISSAGAIGIENGKLTYLSPLSGHYRPTTKSFRRFIDSLKGQGVDMSSLRVSHAYEVLLSMEYYGKSKKDMRKALHLKHRDSDKNSPKLDAKLHIAADDVTATSLVERNWQHEHQRSGLRRLMDDLHIAR